jgi:ribosomal protein S11
VRYAKVVVVGILLGAAAGCGGSGAGSASQTTAPAAYVQAADRAAQSTLRSGMVAAKIIFTTDGSYATFTAAAARSAEPSLDWRDAGVDPGGAGENTVTIQVVTATSLELVAKSAFGRYFCIADAVPGPGVTYGAGDTFASVSRVAACAGGW